MTASAMLSITAGADSRLGSAVRGGGGGGSTVKVMSKGNDKFRTMSSTETHKTNVVVKYMGGVS